MAQRFISKTTKSGQVPDSGIPLQIVDGLPSRALGYPADLVLKYAPYTVGEQEELTLLEDVRDHHSVIKRGIYVETSDPEFTVDDLYFIDFDYIGLLRLLSSFSVPKFTINNIRCTTKSDGTKCGEVGDLVFGPEEIEFEDLTVKELPLIFKSKNFPEGIKCRPPTLKIVNITLGPDFKQLTAAQLLATLIDAPDYKTSLEIVRKLTLEESDVLQTLDKRLRLGIVPLTYKCPACGMEQKVKIDGNRIIRPFRQTSDIEGYEILGL